MQSKTSTLNIDDSFMIDPATTEILKLSEKAELVSIVKVPLVVMVAALEVPILMIV